MDSHEDGINLSFPIAKSSTVVQGHSNFPNILSVKFYIEKQVFCSQKYVNH